jgi:hypothetical protein
MPISGIGRNNFSDGTQVSIISPASAG